MAEWIDSTGRRWKGEFSKAYTPKGQPVKWMNWTTWVEKHTTGSTVQIPVDEIDELIDNLTNVKEAK